MTLSELISKILSESTFEFARSSGAGGQNVNKVNSKAILRWNSLASTIPLQYKYQIRHQLQNHISAEGDLLISSQSSRDQIQNKQICTEKLSDWITACLTPRKKRKPTRPTKSSKLKRLESKKREKTKLAARRKPRNWD